MKTSARHHTSICHTASHCTAIRINTSEVTDMSRIFSGCSCLAAIYGNDKRIGKPKNI
ncbi:hypothetical protein [Prevotella koreensis]